MDPQQHITLVIFHTNMKRSGFHDVIININGIFAHQTDIFVLKQLQYSASFYFSCQFCHFISGDVVASFLFLINLRILEDL